MDTPRRILIVRTGALGDLVHAVPVLTALRRHFPAARFGWVVEAQFVPVLAGLRALELIPIRLRVWRLQPYAKKTYREILASLAALRRFSPDLVLDLMGSHRSGLIAALSGAELRIGPAGPDRWQPRSAFWMKRTLPLRGVHSVDRSLSLLDALGLPPEPADFAGDELFPESLPAPGDYLLIHPGAAWGDKVYPPRLWAEVAHLLSVRTGLPVRIAIAPGEEHLAYALEEAARGAARAIPAPDLPALASLLRGARLVLGGDTGPLHLAHGMGTPVLMLHGPTDPARSGPYGAPERFLVKRLPCSFCYQRFTETKACLLGIPPVQVADRAVELLAAGRVEAVQRAPRTPSPPTSRSSRSSRSTKRTRDCCGPM
jgi:heptosyltransferase-1